MLDVKAILAEITAEIDYAISEAEATVFTRRDAHMWAKGYRKGLEFARERIQQHITIDLRDAPAEEDEQLHYRHNHTGKE